MVNLIALFPSQLRSLYKTTIVRNFNLNLPSLGGTPKSEKPYPNFLFQL